VLTTFEADEYLFEALLSGASGFLGKSVEPDELLDAHALGSVVVLGVLAAVAVVLVHRRLFRALAVTVAGLATATIGASRLYVGVH
jgi:DNA-binding NarL/FixJ family response regulator